MILSDLKRLCFFTCFLWFSFSMFGFVFVEIGVGSISFALPDLKKDET